MYSTSRSTFLQNEVLKLCSANIQISLFFLSALTTFTLNRFFARPAHISAAYFFALNMWTLNSACIVRSLNGFCSLAGAVFENSNLIRRLEAFVAELFDSSWLLSTEMVKVSKLKLLKAPWAAWVYRFIILDSSIAKWFIKKLFSFSPNSICVDWTRISSWFA